MISDSQAIWEMIIQMFIQEGIIFAELVYSKKDTVMTFSTK